MTMTPRFDDVTTTELAVLEQLWQAGSCSTREIADALYPDKPAGHKTVKKLLERLVGKGCVAKVEDEPVQRFAANVDRATLVAKRVQGVADSLCDGSLTPILTHIVEGQSLSKKDREALRKLIDDLDGAKKSKRKR